MLVPPSTSPLTVSILVVLGPAKLATRGTNIVTHRLEAVGRPEFCWRLPV